MIQRINQSPFWGRPEAAGQAGAAAAQPPHETRLRAAVPRRSGGDLLRAGPPSLGPACPLCPWLHLRLFGCDTGRHRRQSYTRRLTSKRPWEGGQAQGVSRGLCAFCRPFRGPRVRRSAAGMVATCPPSPPDLTSRPPPTLAPASFFWSPGPCLLFASRCEARCPICSPRGASLHRAGICHWSASQQLRQRTWGLLPRPTVLRMAPYLLPLHSLGAILLSQTHVQQTLPLAPRWGFGL